ncbi:rhamnan synthesis F family protein [Demequina sp.]|uniref:rhamnan synthesis F family protein n=1 Tax=Demequina sp. TaxID=2050685 RepID=UPI003A88B2B3
MALLVVMAHFDVDQRLRRHVIATITNYARSAERVVVVSTSGVREGETDVLPPNVEFVTRANFGYDFYSYKWALDTVGDYGAYDRIVISNDSFVGPIVPLDTIVESQQAAEYDLMGMTWSRHHGGHAQSFFVTVTGAVARSQGFQRFWRDMVPVSGRTDVIRKYEVGLTGFVRESGFSVGGYFQPTDAELELAQRRFVHQGAVRIIDGKSGLVRKNYGAQPSSNLIFNPAVAYADRFLLDARFPLLKFDTLRFDPYGLDAGRLLREAEAQYPDHMGGVREFLRDTRPSYPYRPRERNTLIDVAELRGLGVGYCMDAEYLKLRPEGPTQ